ncbi:hypothetical protein NDU88_002976 [Pleurodeles waltl]|uniref:Uncharacterized protein n=1 Tax=Pleurodeles waltl TaxID=8319 RepID=A0AAV7KTL0_PLEWA|nr:hypothetical protein NDU88_002976 [Pleurodeles waltl]
MSCKGENLLLQLRRQALPCSVENVQRLRSGQGVEDKCLHDKPSSCRMKRVPQPGAEGTARVPGRRRRSPRGGRSALQQRVSLCVHAEDLGENGKVEGAHTKPLPQPVTETDF